MGWWAPIGVSMMMMSRWDPNRLKLCCRDKIRSLVFGESVFSLQIYGHCFVECLDMMSMDKWRIFCSARSLCTYDECTLGECAFLSLCLSVSLIAFGCLGNVDLFFS